MQHKTEKEKHSEDLMEGKYFILYFQKTTVFIKIF